MIANSVSLLLQISFFKIKKKKKGKKKINPKCFKGEIHSYLVNLNVFMTITSAADFLNKRLYCLPVPFHFLIPILHKDVRVNYSRNGFEIQEGGLSKLECRIAMQNVKKWMSLRMPDSKGFYIYIVNSFLIPAGQRVCWILEFLETYISQQGKMVS